MNEFIGIAAGQFKYYFKRVITFICYFHKIFLSILTNIQFFQKKFHKCNYNEIQEFYTISVPEGRTMKISHRILILIFLNISALIIMAAAIFHLGETEQEYYELSNKNLIFRNMLIEKQYAERLAMGNGFNKEEDERMTFELNKKYSDINFNLFPEKKTAFKEIGNLLLRREDTVKEIMSLSGVYPDTSEYIGDRNDRIDERFIQLYKIDDQILLLTDDITNMTENQIRIREDRELFGIVSGLLLITLLSISATAILGRSISRPIEQLRSYVLSVDISDLRKKNDSSINDLMNSKKNLEITQLAESYINLENTLFEKMRELKEAESYLNNIIQSLNSMIITADSDLHLIHCNNLAEALSDNNEKTLYKRFPFLTEYKEKIHEVLELSNLYSKNAVQIDSKKDRYYNISMTPLAGDNANGIVIRLDDITSLRNIENQMLQAQKWETLGVLTSGFAHDFNNVLTGIVTSSSILLYKSEQNYPDLDKSYIDCLNIIDRSGKRAATMVQQLLSLSRSNEMTFTDIDLNRSIKDIESICRNSFDKSVKIEIEMPDKEIPVKADKTQIEQSILNLCINAHHAMTLMRKKSEKPGGILKISTREKKVDRSSKDTVRGAEPGRYIGISISDTGVGISEDRQKKIFDPFFTTKEKSDGTGLGLTMVQHIVKEHKGFIDFSSEQDIGTVITVYLPASGITEPLSDETAIEKYVKQGTGTILIIDDEELIRTLTRSILKESGYKVITAEDGYSGIDIYRKRKKEIDLIILDMSMPGLSGKETFIELKNINENQKILMASGFAKDERIQDLLNMGLEDFIQKPFNFKELNEKVSEILKT